MNESLKKALYVNERHSNPGQRNSSFLILLNDFLLSFTISIMVSTINGINIRHPHKLWFLLFQISTSSFECSEAFHSSFPLHNSSKIIILFMKIRVWWAMRFIAFPITFCVPLNNNNNWWTMYARKRILHIFFFLLQLLFSSFGIKFHFVSYQTEFFFFICLPLLIAANWQ